MRTLWNYLEQKPWTMAQKRRALFAGSAGFAALAGLLVWLCVGMVLPLDGWSLFGMMGYPAVGGWLAAFLWICNLPLDKG